MPLWRCWKLPFSLLGLLIVLLAFLSLLSAARRCHFSIPLLVYDELGIAFFSVPLEACEVGCLQLIVGLYSTAIRQPGKSKGIQVCVF